LRAGAFSATEAFLYHYDPGGEARAQQRFVWRSAGLRPTGHLQRALTARQPPTPSSQSSRAVAGWQYASSLAEAAWQQQQDWCEVQQLPVWHSTGVPVSGIEQVGQRDGRLADSTRLAAWQQLGSSSLAAAQPRPAQPSPAQPSPA
jgi:hypothetical protein